MADGDDNKKEENVSEINHEIFMHNFVCDNLKFLPQDKHKHWQRKKLDEKEPENIPG